MYLFYSSLTLHKIHVRRGFIDGWSTFLSLLQNDWIFSQLILVSRLREMLRKVKISTFFKASFYLFQTLKLSKKLKTGQNSQNFWELWTLQTFKCLTKLLSPQNRPNMENSRRLRTLQVIECFKFWPNGPKIFNISKFGAFATLIMIEPSIMI